MPEPWPHMHLKNRPKLPEDQFILIVPTQEHLKKKKKSSFLGNLPVIREV